MNYDLIEKAARKFGTPLYVYDEDEFQRHYIELSSAYKAIYGNFNIAYSFKTNYMPRICNQVRHNNGYAEVVSDMEYHLAKRYSFCPERIIVNGPGKWNGIEEMLLDGACVMLDNEYECQRAIEVASRVDKQVRVGFRLNFDIGTNKLSRFGFDASNDVTKCLIELVRKSQNVKICGLHFHLSGSRSIEAWKNRALKMIHYADQLLDDSEKEIIDLGSGMFGHLSPELIAQFAQDVPSFREYAEAVASEFSKKYRGYSKQPLLVVEPGTTLVADVMSYVTKVIATKRVANRSFAIVDGSVQQMGEIGKKKQLPIHVYSCDNGIRLENTDITGYTCLEDDVLYRNVKCSVGVGDLLCFDNCGAYTNVLKPPFIQVGCKIVGYTDTDELHLLKREETVDDILSSYYGG